MDTLIKDIRYGIRSLAKRPGFTAIAVITLALGIGASTAIFSVVDGVLLRPLPYPHAEQLVQLREVNPSGVKIAFAEPNYLDVRARSRTLEAIAQYGGDLTTVTGGSEPVRAQIFWVSGDFFNLLGVKPIVGRTFLSEESKRGGPPVAVVSYGLWQGLLGGKSDLAGATLRLMDQSVAVVGVMPPGFAFHKKPRFGSRESYFRRKCRARLTTGASLPGCVPTSRLNKRRPKLARSVTTQTRVRQGNGCRRFRHHSAAGIHGRKCSQRSGNDFRRGRILVSGGLCKRGEPAARPGYNATARLAVRSALGATRLRLARQFITENLLLALTAGAFGVLLSFWGVNVILGLNQQSLPRMSEIGVNARAVAFT